MSSRTSSLVDLDDGALDDLAVLDVDHGAVDGVVERSASEVVVDDLAGDVAALVVEGAHRRRRVGTMVAVDADGRCRRWDTVSTCSDKVGLLRIRDSCTVRTARDEASTGAHAGRKG